MDNKLYKLMDWPAIEEIVYSESSQPCSILGGHLVKEGYLIQVCQTGCCICKCISK